MSPLHGAPVRARRPQGRKRGRGPSFAPLAGTLALAALLTAASPLAATQQATAGGPDPVIESVTLDEAIRRATRFDPDYVQALGRIDNAAWARRAAISQFIVPSIQASGSFTRFSSESFNIGTAELTSQLAQSSVQASLNLFRGGAKFMELGRTGADIEAAVSDEVRALYETALQTETAYYDVLSADELVGVADERVRRAREQLAVARARVTSGAAVQTDSLQLLLELTRAEVEQLQQRATLRVARYELGRLVGAEGAVDAEPVDVTELLAIGMTEEEAVAEALRRGPEYRTATAEERSAEASLSARRASLFLPQVDLFGSIATFDDHLFPDATVRSQVGIQVSVPVWNGGQREIQLSQARVQRDVARARREDVERGLRRDVVQAYTAFETAVASQELAERGVAVAEESLRVQDARYRRGATTILDLITAQVDLADAEAQLVQARYASRLAIAGLESLLGRRLNDNRTEP